MSLSFKSRVPVFDANVGIGHRHDQRSPMEIVLCHKRLLKLDIAN